MPRPHTDLRRRTVTLDTGRRTVDLSIDGGGHIRRSVRVPGASLVRATDGSGAIGFRGHAAVFNTATWIGSKRYGFFEEIAPGAFTKAIAENDVRFLMNHDPNLVLARTKNDTLRLSQDEVGLAVDADMAPTSYAQDLAILLERGDVTQMSFAFNMIDYSWRANPDGTETLVHTSVELFDVASVTYPAYEAAEGGLRSDILAACRAAGFDDLDIGLLAERLADPDPELIAGLRNLARPAGSAAQATTTPPSDGADQHRQDDPQAETTGATPNPLLIATRAMRTKLQGEHLS